MSNRSSQFHSHRHRVAVLVDEGSNPFELACLTEIFGIDRPELGGSLYELSFCARESRVRMRQDFFTMTEIDPLAALDAAETVVVPNRPDVLEPRHPEVLTAIRSAYARGARLVGTCSGAFTLAEAGVLDTHRVTAHWRWAEDFRQRFPGVDLDETVLYVDDGQILTSAGSAAALDLGLHIVRLDHGAHIAAAVARRLCFTAHRDGGQRQFIEPHHDRASDPSLARVLEWASSHIDHPLTVPDLADHAGTSVATFYRRFAHELGCSPLHWMTARRVDLAAELLETSDLTIEAVAHRCGLGTTANLRRVFRASRGLTPSAYRSSRRPSSAPRARPA